MAGANLPVVLAAEQSREACCNRTRKYCIDEHDDSRESKAAALTENIRWNGSLCDLSYPRIEGRESSSSMCTSASISCQSALGGLWPLSKVLGHTANSHLKSKYRFEDARMASGATNPS